MDALIRAAASTLPLDFACMTSPIYWILRVIILLVCAYSFSFTQTRRLEVPDEIVRQWMSDDYLKRNCTFSQLKKELSARSVDLTDDGRAQLIVEGAGKATGNCAGGICSPTGNCSTAIYRATSSGYQELVSHDAQLVWVRRRMTNGYHDVLFDIHASAYESRLLLYKFDGAKYRLAACFDSS